MSQSYGKTRWKRFAIVMVPSVAATAAIGVSLAQGALAASFNVSGQQFKVAAGELTGNGFAQYGSLDVDKAGGMHPVAVSSFNDAKITNLCQSVVLDLGLPGALNKVSLNIKAGHKGKQVEAKDLFIDLDQLKGDAEFKNINIGVAAGAITKGQVSPADRAAAGKLPGGVAKFDNSFAQEAESAKLTGVQQTAWATSAGTFKLSNLDLSVKPGVHECF